MSQTIQSLAMAVIWIGLIGLCVWAGYSVLSMSMPLAVLAVAFALGYVMGSSH